MGAATGGTGQTTYTKGDLLAASAATTLTKLGVGTDTQVLTADAAEVTGIKWAAAGSFNLTVEDIDAVPTYANLTKISFDQADGFVITNPVGTEAQIDLANIPSTALATVQVAQGGTGATTLTDTGVLLGSGTAAITPMAALAKGSLVVGQTAADPTALVVGANDTVLTADSTTGAGVKWATGGSLTLGRMLTMKVMATPTL